MRLVEVARKSGCPEAALIRTAAEIDWAWLARGTPLGLSAGASAPELLVDAVIAACRERFAVTIEEVRITEENVVFRAPPIARRPAASAA